MLSNEEIAHLYKSNIDSLDNRWQEELFNKLRPLVINRIKKSQKKFNYKDLEQEVFLYIWVAIKTYDCHKNFDFYRWANWHYLKALRAFKKSESVCSSINLECKSTLRCYNDAEKIIFMKKIFNNDTFTERNSEIMFRYYILEETLSELASSFGLSIEGIRKICNKNLVKLKVMYGET